jgi:hypothetical protein
LLRKRKEKLFALLLYRKWSRGSGMNLPMLAEQKKAASTDIEPPKSSTFGVPASDAAIAETAGDRLAGLDVRAQSALLQEAFEPSDPLEVAYPTPSPQRRSFIERFGWRAVKSALGLGVIVIAGVGPVQRMLELSSIEAVVNARLISLRSPIDGRIEDLAPSIGAAVPKGRLMLHISNSRADRARLDDLQRLTDQMEGERPAIAKRLVRLKEIHEQISRQAHAFQAGRIRELEERMMDLKAQVSATEASESEAASTLLRTKTLAASGYQTTVAVERAERDAKIAAQTQTSLNHRLFASVVELEAARRGEYVGDSYNDRPSSLQHADELSVRIAETEVELSSRQAPRRVGRRGCTVFRIVQCGPGVSDRRTGLGGNGLSWRRGEEGPRPPAPSRLFRGPRHRHGAGVRLQSFAHWR